MRPDPISCLRCSFPRTARVSGNRVCFQCRFYWPAKLPFSPAELARLTFYREAVRAGFYTDFPSAEVA
jgi:hypothetical protein